MTLGSFLLLVLGLWMAKAIWDAIHAVFRIAAYRERMAETKARIEFINLLNRYKS